MLINLTNHPSGQWPAEQLTTARSLYSDIVDLPFPNVDPAGDEQYITHLADQYLQKVLDIAGLTTPTVHLMGEMTFTVALLNRLQAHGITAIASTTQRIVESLPSGEKKVKFQFVRFRIYKA